MAGEIRREERSYRRGLVMGLTMAEVMVLIVFCLLLLMGRAFVKAGVNEQDTTALTELRQAIEEASGEVVAESIPSDFIELVRTGRKAHEYLTANGVSQPSESVTELVEMGLLVERTLGKNKMNQEETKAALEFVRTAAETYEEASRSASHGSAAIWLQNVLRCAGACGGNGLQYPSCAVRSNGETALIFTAVLRSDSITVHENWFDELKEQRSGWPLQWLQFDRPLSTDEFLAQTKPMFDWSVARTCRFVVEVRDETGATEKLNYKARLRTVERHFYKHERADRQ